MTDNIKWLTTVPATDCNFKSHLQSAMIEEIEEALSIMTGAGTKGNAFRIAVLSRELSRGRKMERDPKEMGQKESR